MNWKVVRLNVSIGFLTADVTERARPYEGLPTFKKYAIQQIESQVRMENLEQWSEQTELGTPPLECAPDSGHVARQKLRNWLDLQLEPLGLATEECVDDHCCVDPDGSWWPCSAYRLLRGDRIWVADQATANFETETETPLSANTRADLKKMPYSIFVRWKVAKVEAGSVDQKPEQRTQPADERVSNSRKTSNELHQQSGA